MGVIVRICTKCGRRVPGGKEDGRPSPPAGHPRAGGAARLEEVEQDQNDIENDGPAAPVERITPHAILRRRPFRPGHLPSHPRLR